MNEADIAIEYRESMKEKESIARSVGRERAACGMKTDMIPTKREYESKCGEVMTYNYNRPMTWKEFKAWDEAHRKEYIEFLFRKYNASTRELGEMFGVSYKSVWCEATALNAKFKKRTEKQTFEQLKAWERFLHPTNETYTEEQQVKEEKTVEENQFKLTINSGEVEAHGKTAEVMPKLVTYLGGILPKSVKVKIIWEVEE